MAMFLIGLAAIIAGSFSLGGIFVWFREVQPRLAKEKREAERNAEYTQNGRLGTIGIYLKRSGWTRGLGEYHIASFDNGFTWWSIIDPRNVEKANEDLVKHLKGIDDLVEYAKENGPIGSKQITESDIAIMNAAGITTRKN